MSTHVLVTGGAGYLGAVLCERLLAAGFRVTVIDNLLYQQRSLFHLCASPAFEFVYGDVRDASLMRRYIAHADALVPLAAIVGAPACDRDPETAESVNLGAIRLLNRLRRPDQLVIFPTTNSGYGQTTGGTPCTEDTPLTPISLYGRTKVLAEQELLDSPNVITLRLATVFGCSPRMRWDLLVNHFVSAAVSDGYLVIFEKEFTRNYIHIRDVADGIQHCLAHAGEMAGRAYNAGLESANLSKAQLAERVKAHVPSLYIHYAEIGRDPDQRNYVVSNQRLREAGFEARRSIDDGIRELIQGWRLMSRSTVKNV